MNDLPAYDPRKGEYVESDNPMLVLAASLKKMGAPVDQSDALKKLADYLEEPVKRGR